MRSLPNINLIEVLHSGQLYKKKTSVPVEMIEDAIVRHYMGESYEKLASEFTSKGHPVTKHTLYAQIYRYYQKHKAVQEQYGTRAQKDYKFAQEYKKHREEVMAREKGSRLKKTSEKKAKEKVKEKVVRPKFRPRSILTPELVMEIRARAPEETYSGIRRDLVKRGINIGVCGVRNVIKRKTWKEIP